MRNPLSKAAMARTFVTSVIIIVCVSESSEGASTAFTGSTGLIFVPTADVVHSNDFAFGGVLTDAQAYPGKQFPYFAENNLPSFYFAGYLTVGYVPRLEITIRGNGMPDTAGPATGVGPYYTDGMISFQFLLMNGSGLFPAVAIGMQDLYGFMIFNAAYTVATWHLPLDAGRTVSLTAGVAVDWYDKNIGTQDDFYEPNHVMGGLLLGAEYPLKPALSAIVEYDSRSLNAGLRLRPATWCTLDLATMRSGLDDLARGRIRGFAAHLHFDGTL
jgi:hypothetical protein